MRRILRRRGTGFALVSALGVLALCSAAFACTNYRGKMTVTGSAGGTVVAVGLGQNSGMNYCTDPRLTGPATVDGPVPGPTGTATGTVTISTEGAKCSTNGLYSELDAGAYTVTWNSDFAMDCMGQPGGTPEAVLGTFTVGAGGVGGPTTYNMPAVSTGFGNYSGVCITSTTQTLSVPFQGNKAPVQVI